MAKFETNSLDVPKTYKFRTENETSDIKFKAKTLSIFYFHLGEFWKDESQKIELKINDSQITISEMENKTTILRILAEKTFMKNKVELVRGSISIKNELCNYTLVQNTHIFINLKFLTKLIFA